MITGMNLTSNLVKPEDSEIIIHVTHKGEDLELLISGDGTVTLTDDFEGIRATGNIVDLIGALK